jgi:xanthosine utilization system XapX-like protein
MSAYILTFAAGVIIGVLGTIVWVDYKTTYQ